jgi:hypothetical protein
MITRRPILLAVVLFGSSPTPPPNPVSELDRRHKGRLRKRDNFQPEEEEKVSNASVQSRREERIGRLWAGCSMLTHSCYIHRENFL